MSLDDSAYARLAVNDTNMRPPRAPGVVRPSRSSSVSRSASISLSLVESPRSGTGTRRMRLVLQSPGGEALCIITGGDRVTTQSKGRRPHGSPGGSTKSESSADVVSPEQRADRISSPGGWSGNSVDTASSGRRVQRHASPGKSVSSGKSYGSSNSRSGCRLRLIQSSPGGKSSKSSGSGAGSVSKSHASIWLDQVVQAKLRSPNPHSKGQLNHDSTNI